MRPEDTPGPEMKYREGWSDCGAAVREELLERAVSMFRQGHDAAAAALRDAAETLIPDAPAD